MITIELIQQVVANHYGIKVSDMKAKKITRSISYPSHVAMYLSRELTENSLPKIGEEFGGRDHTTVMHACDKIGKEIQQDPSLQLTVKELIDAIQSS